MYFKAAILTGKKKIRIEDITFKSINYGQVLVKNISIFKEYVGMWHWSIS